MKKFSSERFQMAREFLLHTARPIDRALYAYEFEHGSADDVFEALRSFQNEDGGFGNGIEPDIRLPLSSAIATTVALQIISHLNAEESPMMATIAINYLYDTFNAEHKLWVSVPESVANYPRAVWWEHPSLEKAQEQWANPSVEILGFMYEFPNSVPRDLKEKLLEKAFHKLDTYEGTLEMHELLCYLRLVQRLPAEPQTKLYAKLDTHVLQAVADTPDKWRNYGLQPLQIAPSPDSRYYPMLAGQVDANLDFRIEEQGEDGVWNPSWQWWRYDDEWLQAKAEWQGVLTLENLRILRAYGRLDDATFR